MERKPPDNWRQLKFRFFMCLPSGKCGCISFFILFWVSLAFTIVLLTYTNEIIQHEVCSFPDKVHVSDKMKSPVFVYLKYKDYYQNYRQYAKSMSLLQLHGEHDENKDINCHPINELNDLPYDGVFYNYEHTKILENSTDANPCGLVPASYVNYTIHLWDNDGGIDVHTGDIEWETYESNKFKNSGSKQYLDKEKKHFAVWMRIAATKDFLKLYGKIEHDVHGHIHVDLKKGIKYLETKGKPCVLISTANNMGGKNQVLGWTMLFCTVLSLAWVVVFVFINRIAKNWKIEQVFAEHFTSSLK
jgi:hypothetical protein